MAQKIEVLLIDDLDGSEAHETVAFGLDGNQYEIDLSDKHAEEFRKTLAAFVEAGRKTAARRGRKPASMNVASAEKVAAKATNGTKGKRGGGRKRPATMEEIEASKAAEPETPAS